MAPVAKKSRSSSGAPAMASGGSPAGGGLKSFFGAKDIAKTNVASANGNGAQKKLFFSQSGDGKEVAGDEAKTDAQPAAEATETKADPGSPAAEVASQSLSPATPQSSPPGSTPNPISQEQLQSIEEKRRQAMERQQAKKRALEEMEENNSPSGSAIGPLGGAPAATVEPTEPKKATFPWPGGPPKGAQMQTKTSGKANAKGKAKAKVASPFAAAATAASLPDTTQKAAEVTPMKSTQSTPDLAERTPEKMAPPQQEKRPSPRPTHPPGKFEAVRCDGWKQYVSLYTVRLKQLRGSVQQEARSLWGGQVGAQGFRADISGFRQSEGQDVVVIGVLFKEMKGRPDVIAQYRDHKLAARTETAEALAMSLAPGAYCTEEDTLWLEDHSMRVQLVMPSFQIAQLATGLVAGVKGTATEDGHLRVTGMIFSRLPPPPALPSRPTASSGGDQFLALVSGLMPNSVADGIPSALAEMRDRFVSFVAAGFGGVEVQRLIVCGGALCNRHLAQGERLSKEELSAADEVLAKLATSVSLEVMPGRMDPTNLSMPQMPLHPHLFRRARAVTDGSFRCVSNPHKSVADGCSVLGHSGQPIQDLLRCTRGTAPLDLLQQCLEARHLAPTAPDTLPMPPLADNDPFIIDEVPHVLFSGGHTKAEHRWVVAPRGESDMSGTQLVCVPAFQSHPAVVLVNLRDPRDVRVQEFGPLLSAVGVPEALELTVKAKVDAGAAETAPQAAEAAATKAVESIEEAKGVPGEAASVPGAVEAAAGAAAGDTKAAATEATGSMTEPMEITEVAEGAVGEA